MSNITDSATEILAALPGMNASRAELLRKLLPGLGRQPFPLLVESAGLGRPSDRAGAHVKNARAIQSLLMSVYLDARMDSGSKIGILLRRLHSAHPEEHPRLCLVAILRHCHHALIHSCNVIR